jgi:hypothetical protein
MSATFTWSIEYMQCKPTEGSYTDVVILAGWRCIGAQDTYLAANNGSVGFLAPEGTFTPYDQLTQEQVLGWVWANGVDKVQIEANIQEQIDKQINPPIVQLPLPWIAPAA